MRGVVGAQPHDRLATGEENLIIAVRRRIETRIAQGQVPLHSGTRHRECLQTIGIGHQVVTTFTISQAALPEFDHRITPDGGLVDQAGQRFAGIKLTLETVADDSDCHGRHRTADRR